MIESIFLGIIAIFLCLLSTDKEKGLKSAFILVAIFLSLRYDWGNDYADYLKQFGEYGSQSFGLFDIEASGEMRRHNEFGWVILNRVFNFLGFGFFGLVIALSFFECWALFRLVRKYVDPKYYWVAILFWIFSTSFCIDASMMRQYLCICLYFFVIDLMIEKKVKGYLLWSIGIIALGSSIHRSFVFTLLSLPLFYLGIKRGRSTTIWLILIGVVFILWNEFGRGLIEPLVYDILSDQEDYSEYMIYVGAEKSNGVTSGIGTIFHDIMFVMWLLLLPNVERNKQSLVLLIITGYFFGVLVSIAPLAGRLSLYFNAVSLIAWSYLFSMTKKWPALYVVFLMQIAVLIREFIGFYYNPLWYEKCYHYHTIFEAANWM